MLLRHSAGAQWCPAEEEDAFPCWAAIGWDQGAAMQTRPPPACTNSLSPLRQGQAPDREQTLCRELRQRGCRTESRSSRLACCSLSSPAAARSAEELVLPGRLPLALPLPKRP